MKVTVYVHENGGSPKAWAVGPMLSQGYIVVFGSWQSAGRLAWLNSPGFTRAQAVWINGDSSAYLAKVTEKERKGYELFGMRELSAVLDPKGLAYAKAQEIFAQHAPEEEGEAGMGNLPEEPESALAVVWASIEKNVPWGF